MATLNLTPIYAGYGDKASTDFVQSNISGGMPRTQLDLVGGVSVVNLVFRLSPVGHQYWKSFFYNTIKTGALPFNINLDIEGYSQTYSVQIVNNSVNRALAYVRGNDVSFQVYAKPVVDAEYMQGITDIYEAYDEESYLLLEAIAQFANVDSQVLT